MLVYLKQPMGYTSVDNKRVYGKCYAYGAFGPTNISMEAYAEHKNILIEAEYTKDWLDKKYNEDFPDTTFKLSELNKIDYATLSKIANLVGIKHHKSRRKPTTSELIALRRSVAAALNKAS